jgi:hypothetical protein
MTIRKTRTNSIHAIQKAQYSMFRKLLGLPNFGRSRENEISEEKSTTSDSVWGAT